jgi:transposase-like protein
MNNPFTNLHTIERYFTNENVCIEYLEHARWNNKPACLKCGALSPYVIKNNGKKGYKCKECNYKFNVLIGTIFENSKIPLIKWFKAIYIVFSHKKGISSYQLGKDLGFSQKTSWFVLGRIRKLAEEKTPFMLSGTVQVDETFVGGKISNKHQSHRARIKRNEDGSRNWKDNKSVVLGLLDQNGKVISKVLPNAQHESIIPAMLASVEKGSTMVSDEWAVYKVLVKLGYKHESVQHKINEYVRDGFTTNSIEGYFSLLKRGIIGIYHQVSAKHLHRYCNEFSYRYNTREIKDHERFHQVLKKIDFTRLTYKNYIKVPEPQTPVKM